MGDGMLVLVEKLTGFLYFVCRRGVKYTRTLVQNSVSVSNVNLKLCVGSAEPTPVVLTFGISYIRDRDDDGLMARLVGL